MDRSLYAPSQPLISISYDVVGSGEGVRRFLADAVDFAGSDEILNDSESAKAGGAIMIPITAGMVVIAYNIPGVTGEIKAAARHLRRYLRRRNPPMG